MSRRQLAVTLFWLLAAALLAHGAGLRNGFVYDDHRFVVENPGLRSAPLALALDPALQTADADRDVWRPLRALSQRFDSRRGLGPFGFHLHSLLLHLLNVVLGTCLLAQLLPADWQRPGAMLGGLLLAVHPLGVEVVAWISSRGDLQALLGAQLALLIVLAEARQQRPGRRLTLGLLGACATFAAVLGKESAAWVAAVALLAVVLARRSAPTLPASARLAPLRLGAALWLLIGAASALALRQWAMQGATPIQTSPHGGDFGTQAGWALFGTARTLWHLVWPTQLSIEYDQDAWLSGPPVWLRPEVWAVVALVVAVLVLATRRPVPALLLGWILLAWLPSSSLLVTLRSLVNDRGAYPLLLPAGALLALPLLRRPRALPFAAVLLAALLIPLSVQRTADFRDDETLWSAALAHDPDSARALLALAHVAARRGDLSARQEWLAAAARAARPGSRWEGVARARLGAARLHSGADPESARIELQRGWQLLVHHNDGRGLRTDELGAACDLAEALVLTGRDAEADALLAAVAAAAPDSVVPHVKRASLDLYRYARAEPHAAASWLEAAAVALAAATARDPAHPLVGALDRQLRAARAAVESGPAREPPD